MIISAKKELLAHVLEKAPKSLRKQKKDSYNQGDLIYRKSFRKVTFTKEFIDIEFKNCKFFNCNFENVWGYFFILNNCEFDNCEFKNSRFSHLDSSWGSVEFNKCIFKNVQFDEGSLFNIFFEKCDMMSFNLLGFVPISNIQFLSCSIENAQFQSLVYYKDDNEIDKEFKDLLFHNCRIHFCTFNTVDLFNSALIDNYIFKSSFIDCRIGKETISYNKNTEIENYASIDFQSILKSEEIDSQILRIYFKVFAKNLKEITSQITTEIKFKSVFISYSFKDKIIANHINIILNRRGVKTFLWEKDAPAGQRLNDIMSNNIRKHDKLLFISSQNSIKSNACQYEISQGRKKVDETWVNIFFPIHIDDFLFNVKKDQIRPTELIEEYWTNIEEIRRVNSVDFSKFNIATPNLQELEAAVDKVVRELKLTNESTQ